MRLTPLQTKKLINVHETWGDCFGASIYTFLPGQLIRWATAEETDAHVAKLRKNLAAAHEQLVEAVATAHYGNVACYAQACANITDDIRIPKTGHFYCLTDQAKEHARKLIVIRNGV